MELNPGPENQHIVTFDRIEMYPTRDISDWHTYVLKVGQACAMDEVKGGVVIKVK